MPMKPSIVSNSAIICAAILLCSFPLGNLLRMSNGTLAVYPHDLLLLVWLSIYGFTHRHEWHTLAVRFTPLQWLLIGWTALGFVLTSIRQPSLVPLLYAIRVLMYIVGGWTLVKALPSKVRTPFVAVAGLVYQALAVLLYIWMPDMRFLWVQGWDDHYYRVIGTLFDPAFTGILAILTAIFIWHQYVHEQWKRWPVMLFLATTVLLTFSRASYLAALVAVLVTIRMRSRSALLASIGVLTILISIWWIIPKPGGEGVDLLRTTSIQARLEIAALSIRNIKWHTLITGTGLFTRYTSPENPMLPHTTAHFPDNIILLFIIQTGLPGFVLWTLAFFAYYNKLGRHHLLSQTTLTAVLVHAQFNNTVFQPFVLLYLVWILATDDT